jgi:hypothetical protein
MFPFKLNQFYNPQPSFTMSILLTNVRAYIYFYLKKQHYVNSMDYISHGAF